MPHFNASIFRIAVASLAALSVAACVQNSMPNGYNGPVAQIQGTGIDRMHDQDLRRADLFFVEKIDDRRIEPVTAHTPAMGGRWIIEAAPHSIPAKQATFRIVGFVQYIVNFQALMDPVCLPKGDVTFAPVAGHSYLVKGDLGRHHSSVWIEDSASGQMIEPKVECVR